MKTFPKAKLKTEFINDFGETMKLVVDSDDHIWVHHDDCNEDYEELKNFKYILNDSEIAVITGFIEMARDLYHITSKTGEEFVKFHLAVKNELANLSLN